MNAVVEDGCISCGLCTTTCPDVFRMNDEGVAEAYSDLTEENKDAAEEARDGCPVSVINIEG